VPQGSRAIIATVAGSTTAMNTVIRTSPAKITSLGEEVERTPDFKVAALDGVMQSTTEARERAETIEEKAIAMSLTSVSIAMQPRNLRDKQVGGSNDATQVPKRTGELPRRLSFLKISVEAKMKAVRRRRTEGTTATARVP